MNADELDFRRTYMASTRSHLANERTHLSYLRTSLSLMSFGVTLNRFSIYLSQGEITQTNSPDPLFQMETIGAVITILGAIILCWAIHRYRKVEVAIEKDQFKSSSTPLMIISLGILAIGAIVSIWMVLEWQ